MIGYDLNTDTSFQLRTSDEVRGVTPRCCCFLPLIHRRVAVIRVLLHQDDSMHKLLLQPQHRRLKLSYNATQGVKAVIYLSAGKTECHHKTVLENVQCHTPGSLLRLEQNMDAA